MAAVGQRWPQKLIDPQDHIMQKAPPPATFLPSQLPPFCTSYHHDVADADVAQQLIRHQGCQANGSNASHHSSWLVGEYLSQLIYLAKTHITTTTTSSIDGAQLMISLPALGIRTKNQHALTRKDYLQAGITKSNWFELAMPQLLVLRIQICIENKFVPTNRIPKYKKGQPYLTLSHFLLIQ